MSEEFAFFSVSCCFVADVCVFDVVQLEVNYQRATNHRQYKKNRILQE